MPRLKGSLNKLPPTPVGILNDGYEYYYRKDIKAWRIRKKSKVQTTTKIRTLSIKQICNERTYGQSKIEPKFTIREGFSKDRNILSPLSQKMCEFVSTHTWTHWATFTFSEQTNDYGARRNVERFFDRFFIPQESMYYVIESGSKYGRTHCHAILKLGNDSTHYLKEHQHERSHLLFNKWLKTYGRNQVRRFQYNGGAVEYITNYLQKSTIDWDLIGKPTRR